MTKRTSVGLIYFGMILMTLLLRVSSALDVYSALGVDNIDAYFTCVVQLLIFGVMPLALYTIVVTRRQDGSLLKDFGVKRIGAKNWLCTAALSVCMIAVTSGVSFVWQLALSMIGYTHTSSSTDYSSVGVLFEQLALVAVLPAIFEEVAHRGLIYAGYRECGYKFVLVSALLFSLMHQNIVQTGYTFVDGAVMALVMYYTGSIFPAMFMHFANNAYSVFSGYVEQNGGAFDFINKISDWLRSTAAGLAVSALAVVALGALAVLILTRMRKWAVQKGNVPARAFEATETAPLKKDVPFIITVAMGVAATAFSLVWGIMR